jgi:N-acetylmuramoyl-L-alanine amidase
MEETMLRRGDRSAAVADLQQRLVTAGYSLLVDGNFDEATEGGVRAFQKARGLYVDGICGPETWGRLIESSYRLGDRLLYLRQPMLRGDDVAELQRRLNALGFDAGREDGMLGPETEAAIRLFQRDAGLATDAVCGPATTAALQRMGSLAEGSVARIREREAWRRDDRPLRDRVCFLVVDPELAVLGGGIARRLREIGAVVAGPALAHPGRAAEANKLGADIFVALGSGTDSGARCAYFATEHFRSEGGFAVATQLTDALASVLSDVQPPVGRTYRYLRETKMAAVVCELFSRDDPAGAGLVATLIPRLASAIVEGLRRGVESPLDFAR